MEVHSAMKVNRNNDKPQECDTEQKEITPEHMLHDSACCGSATGTGGFHGQEADTGGGILGEKRQ